MRSRCANTTLVVCLLIGTVGSGLTAQPAYTQIPDHPVFAEPRQEPPAPSFDQEHLRLALRIDFDPPRLLGEAVLHLRLLDAATDTLRLTAAGLAIDSVRIAPPDSVLVPRAFQIDASGALTIPLDSVHRQAPSLHVRIHYTALPSAALHLTRQGPARTVAWTDARPGLSPHWFPTPPTPGDRFTSEVLITVDPALRVLANGRLVDERPDADSLHTFRFQLDEPHTASHVAFAAGPFDIATGEVQVSNRRTGLPLAYAVLPEYAGTVARTFGHTPEALHVLSTWLRTPYPWSTYAQIAVPGRPFESMPPAGLTLVSDRMLLDARAALDEETDLAVARNAAQQWMGGLIAPFNGNDAWLTEGLATYLAILFVQETQGDEAFAASLLALRTAYFNETRDYRRPLAWPYGDLPARLFDAHATAKGAWLQHMLHRRLGDDAYRELLARFLAAYAYQPVETDDFLGTLERQADDETAAFFAQWVAAAGHPVLDVQYQHDPSAGTLTVTVEQRQNGYRVPDVFEIPLTIEVRSLTDSARFEIDLDQRRQSFTLPFDPAPRYVVVDPDLYVLADIRVAQDARAWAAQLRYAPLPQTRAEAAAALPTFGDDPALAIALRGALGNEPSAWVRAAVVEAMGRLPASAAIERALLDALPEESDATVRVAMLDALGTYTSAQVHDVAYHLAQRDDSYQVQAAAVRALAQSGSPDALDIIRSALITPSHRDIIRATAIDALLLLDVPAAQTLDLVLPYTQPDQSIAARQAAIRVFHPLASGTRAALQRLMALLQDASPAVRRAAAEALHRLGTEAAQAALEDHLADETDPLLKADVAYWLRTAESP